MMKKLTVILAVIFTLFFLVNTANVLAKDAGEGCNPKIANDCGKKELSCQPIDLSANPPTGICRLNITISTPDKGFSTLGNAVSNILTLAFALAVLVVLVMLIMGAFEWITSGGDKEEVAKARNRIINALIGLAVLAVAFALARVAGQFTGLDINNLTIPGPDSKAPGL